MLEQAPNEKPSLPLEFETDQTAFSQDVVSQRNTRLIWAGFGFAALMLIGVSACELVPLASYASTNPSRFSTAAYKPSLPALSPGGIRPAMHPASFRRPAHVRMQEISSPASEGSPAEARQSPAEARPPPGPEWKGWELLSEAEQAEIIGLDAQIEKRSSKRRIAQNEINKQLFKAKDSDTVLQVYEAHENLNAVNVATALHRLATINKKDRAGRDKLWGDERFQHLVDKVQARAPDFRARAINEVLWSFATLQQLPPMLLKPVLTAVAVTLGKSDDPKEAFEAHHLSTMVWSLARLETKPVRLLEQMEEQAIPLIGELDSQNCAMLLSGFARLNYKPSKLLPALSAHLIEGELLAKSKPVEVADIAQALSLIDKSPSEAAEHAQLLRALAVRAAPDTALSAFSSRQLVILTNTFTKFNATAALPEGLLDAWVDAIRTAHEERPMMSADAKSLEASLSSLGIDCTWIKRAEMLKSWSDLSAGGQGIKREYTDEELLKTFQEIDTDKSGDIDQKELLSAIRAINPAASLDQIQTMLSFGDSDGDMAISFDEFKNIIRCASDGRFESCDLLDVSEVAPGAPEEAQGASLQDKA